MSRLIVSRIAAMPLAIAAALTIGVSAHAQSNEQENPFDAIDWKDGPAEGRLGSVGKLAIPEGCRFTDASGAHRFMELTENPPGDEIGVLLCATAPEGNPAASDTWFVVFEYDESGYVKDDEKSQLDADKILATLQEGNEAGNRERRRRGWTELTLDGWERPPYYDEGTHNLTWATRGISEGDTSVNHSVRLLGRGGVMKADLVTRHSSFEHALPAFANVVAGTAFLPGNTYGEWRAGDKVAAYGLTALVAGGAAAKLGLFGKLWKAVAAAGKAIIVGVIAVVAWLRSLFRRKKTQTEATPA
jgi:uncharacterized membrane-anchored protein